jgi:hypothetical protein
MSHGDFAIIANSDSGLLAENKWPPGARWRWSQDRAFIAQGLLTGSPGRNPQFSVELVLIDMRQQLIEQSVGVLGIQDVIGGEEGGEAPLVV